MLHVWYEIKHLPKFCTPSSSNNSAIEHDAEGNPIPKSIPNTYDSGSAVGPVVGRDKAKRAMEIMKERAEKKKTNDKMVEILENNGKHLSSLSSFITNTSVGGHAGQAHKQSTNSLSDTSSIQETIKLLMAAGQKELAEKMLAKLSSYQMNEIDKLMGMEEGTGKHESVPKRTTRKSTVSTTTKTVYEINDSDRDSHVKEIDNQSNPPSSPNSLNDCIGQAKNDSDYDVDSLDLYNA
jgi:hypothetical protein